MTHPCLTLPPTGRQHPNVSCTPEPAEMHILKALPHCMPVGFSLIQPMKTDFSDRCMLRHPLSAHSDQSRPNSCRFVYILTKLHRKNDIFKRGKSARRFISGKIYIFASIRTSCQNVWQDRCTIRGKFLRLSQRVILGLFMRHLKIMLCVAIMMTAVVRIHAQDRGSHHSIGLWGAAGYSGLMSDVDSTSLGLGYGASAGVMYEFQKHHFIINLGVGFQWQDAGTKLDDIASDVPNQRDDQNDMYTLRYRFKDRTDRSRSGSLQVPLMLVHSLEASTSSPEQRPTCSLCQAQRQRPTSQRWACTTSS